MREWVQGLQPLPGHHRSPSILTNFLGKCVPLTTWEMPPSARGRTAPHIPTTVPTGLLIRGAQGVEYRLMDRGSLKKTKHRHIPHQDQDDSFIHWRGEGNLLEKQACKETWLMTLDYFEEQLTSEETNLRMDFELEIMLPTQAKSNRRGSDQCNLSLLSIFPPQWCTLKIFSFLFGLGRSDIWASSHLKTLNHPSPSSKAVCLRLFWGQSPHPTCHCSPHIISHLSVICLPGPRALMPASPRTSGRTN